MVIIARNLEGLMILEYSAISSEVDAVQDGLLYSVQATLKANHHQPTLILLPRSPAVCP